MKKVYRIILPVLFLPVALLSCKKDSDTSSSRLTVKLTDAPADYDAVNVDVQKVEAHIAGGKGAGWTEITARPGIYNLLDLTNGIDTVVGSSSGELNGKVTQVRLVLGPNNSITVDGLTYPLIIPSGAESGLKIQVNKDLGPDNNQIVLDFDVARSVRQTDSATYHLRPVIKVMNSWYTGIRGEVAPAQRALITAISSSKDTSTTFSREDGFFLIRGLEKGAYTLIVSDSAASSKTLDHVDVKEGRITDVGVVSTK